MNLTLALVSAEIFLMGHICSQSKIVNYDASAAQTGKLPMLQSLTYS